MISKRIKVQGYRMVVGGTFFALLLCSNMLAGQANSAQKESYLQFELSYTSDIASNLSGGIKRGYGYLGLASIGFGFDSENAGMWKGGQLFVQGAYTHGATPSADFFGDMQVVSNIEAGNHAYIQELWAKQAFGKMELTIGLQDLNVEFANSQHGELFVNSSFGILPIISSNVEAPLFPLTSLGLTVKWSVSPKTTWLGAIYDGRPTEFDYNPYNVKWEFASGDGILAISEMQQQFSIGQQPGLYKLGAYTHNHLVERSFKSNFPDSLNHTTLGIYLYADQMVWAHSGRSIGMFLQAGYSPTKISTNNAYIGLGASVMGLLSRKKDDRLGLALAHASLNNRVGGETAIELTWYKRVHRNIYIQPDMQYIIQPSGMSSTLANCLAGIIRVGLEL